MLDLKPWRLRAISAYISVNTADSKTDGIQRLHQSVLLKSVPGWDRHGSISHHLV